MLISLNMQSLSLSCFFKYYYYYYHYHYHGYHGYYYHYYHCYCNSTKGRAQKLPFSDRLSQKKFLFSHVTIKFSLSQFNTLWSAAQSKLPKNIFIFTIQYINNSLPTRKNLVKWNLAPRPECCMSPETQLHVISMW